MTGGLGLASGAGQGVIAVAQKIARQGRLGVNQEGDDENVGVPKDVSPVAETGEGFGRDADPVVVTRGSGQYLKQVVTHGQLGQGVPLNDHVAGLPDLGPDGFVGRPQRCVVGQVGQPFLGGASRSIGFA